MTLRPLARVLTGLVALLPGILASGPAAAQSARGLDARSASVIEYWTAERRAAAIPRDLVVDERGLGYLRLPNGNGLVPYGHEVAAQATPMAGDTVAPSITGMSPAQGATIGSAATFSATVTDTSGVKSVSFKIQKGSGLVQSFSASKGAGDVWSVNLSGFTDGAWSWSVVAKDGAKPSNTATSPTLAFTVGSGGGGGGGSGMISSDPWTAGGNIQNAAGRIYFEMPSNSRRTRWAGYVCSGTVVTDTATDRSIILTASHCVYDDAYKAFARKVLFIPNQDGTTGSGTDLNCSNDPLGCWAPTLGVVDVNWTTRTFPDNVAWDYAFYVVGNNSHSGTAAPSVLDAAVFPMNINFSLPPLSLTYGLGYSYDMDPNFMYCTDNLQNASAANWLLPGCGLTGGSSGGPWVQPNSGTTFNGTNGDVISVNSWGYTNQPGMYGPKLSGNTACAVFGTAQTTPLTTNGIDGDAGVKVTSTATTCP